MNWKVLWQKISTSPYFVTAWTLFAGALGEQILRLVNNGSFDFTLKGVEEMLSAAASTTVIALVHLYMPSPKPQMLATTPPSPEVHEVPAVLKPADPSDVPVVK